MSNKSYTLAPIPGGGKPPEVGKILSTTFSEFGDNIAPYAILAVLQMVVAIPLVFIGIFGGYILSAIVVTLVYMVGMAISLGLGAGLGSVIGDDLGGAIAAIGMLVTMFASLLAWVASFVGIILVISLPLAPIQAAAQRAVAAYQRGGPSPEPASLFATLSQDLVQVLLLAAAMAASVLVGLLCFGVGVFVPMYLFAFAPTLVSIHRMGAIAAMRASAKHAMGDTSWHLMYTLLNWGISVAASNIPVIGPAFLLAFHVRAHRELFGDGELPAGV